MFVAKLKLILNVKELFLRHLHREYKETEIIWTSLLLGAK